MSNKQPNILWICTDQQRYDTLGCYGNSFVNTPNLDSLANTGVLFENTFCMSPVCTPSRASFLTGRFPRTTRCRQNGHNIPEDEVLVTKLLSEAGYRCGLSGKLHLSACHPSVCKDTERRIDDGYTDFHWSHHHDPDWEKNEYIQWLKEKGVEFRRKSFRASNYVSVSMPAELHQTTWCAEKAINFIERQAAKDSPWLFSVNIFDPHHPFDPPQELLESYQDRLEDIPLPNYIAGELDKKPCFQKIDHRGSYGHNGEFDYETMTDADHKLVRAAYWAMCDLIDRQVGRMLETLRQTGQLENTIVIFTSDHGEMLGDHGIYWKGPFFYEPAIKVPLIISCPGLISGNRRFLSMVELMDLAPTLLEAAGLEIYSGMQGKSLWQTIKSESSGSTGYIGRNDVYCEYLNAMPWHTEPAAYATMIRTQRYKLVSFHTIELGELYDLEKDPSETKNLWNDTEYLEVQMNLLKRLNDRISLSVDPLPPRISPW